MCCAVALLHVEDRILRDIHKVGDGSRDAPDQGHQDPALGTVDPGEQAAADILPTTKLAKSCAVGYAVVYPVGRGELIIPGAFVQEGRGSHRIFH